MTEECCTVDCLDRESRTSTNMTSRVGPDSIREILSEDARFPTTKSRLLKDQGWKVFQDLGEVRKISTVIEKLPERGFNSLDDLLAELRGQQGLFSPE